MIKIPQMGTSGPDAELYLEIISSGMRKIFLLSLCLFGYAVPELQEELEMPRLYPD